MPENTVPKKDVATREEGERVPTTRESGRYLMPAVDILETEDSLVVLADMPGVSTENVHVTVDNEVLTVEGRVTEDQAGEPVYTEYRLLDYYRQFRLSEQVDQDNISAELKRGVLRLELPKVEKARPKKIDVKVS